MDGELPASTIREGAAMIVAGIESGEPGPGTLRIVTPDLRDRPIPDLATVEGLAASPVVDALDPHLPVVLSAADVRGASWNCLRTSSASCPVVP